MKTLETREEIWNALQPYNKSWIPENFLKHLIWAKDRGAITHVEVADNTIPNRWDGVLYIKLAAKTQTQFVINHFVMPSRADEITMPDKNTLRLWWD